MCVFCSLLSLFLSLPILLTLLTFWFSNTFLDNHRKLKRQLVTSSELKGEWLLNSVFSINLASLSWRILYQNRTVSLTKFSRWWQCVPLCFWYVCVRAWKLSTESLIRSVNMAVWISELKNIQHTCITWYWKFSTLVTIWSLDIKHQFYKTIAN